MTVDTTVQEKAVSYPNDSRLLNRSRGRLFRLCRKHAEVLRQSYARKGPKALLPRLYINKCACNYRTIAQLQKYGQWFEFILMVGPEGKNSNPSEFTIPI